MISYAFGFAILILALVLVQFGVMAAVVMIGILAIVFSAILGLVVYLITAGRGIFNERKTESHF